MTSANLFSTDGAAPTPVSPLRVMMVCTGNICRSPMAEIVLRACRERCTVTVQLGKHGLQGIIVRC